MLPFNRCGKQVDPPSDTPRTSRERDIKDGGAVLLSRRKLPSEFLRGLADLESSYVSESDAVRQSGFGGGPERWRLEHEPILDAVTQDGDILDVGCANGHLLECLMAWSQERGLSLTPHGLDQGQRLVGLAKRRLPEFQANFHVGNAWDWEPPRRYRYVYELYDCVPADYLPELLHRIHDGFVTRPGRLIVGAYV